MDYYLFFTLIIFISLFFFGADFLSDSQIVKDETKIGLLSYLHHFISIHCTIGLPICVLFNKNVVFLLINLLLGIIAQYAWLIYKEDCPFTTFVNKIINKNKPDRIWRSDACSLFKHYVRGEKWAYKDIYNKDKTNLALYYNVIVLLNGLFIFIQRNNT